MWPFNRKPKPSPAAFNQPRTKWAIGDMAECVNGRPWYRGRNEVIAGPGIGEKLMVRLVFVGSPDGHTTQSVALLFVGYPGTRGYNECNFRKIVLAETGADRTVSARVPGKVGV